jgi:hypothetical protein
MNTRDIVLAAAVWFLLAVAQLLAALAGVVGAMVGAVGVGLAALGIWRLFHVRFESARTPLSLVGTASAAGIALSYISRPDPVLWLGPVAALLAAAMVWLATRGRAKRCALCNRRLGEVALGCPRCGLVVCDSGCWVHEHCRCRLCEDNRVPIFPPEGRWWDQRLGPRMRQGRCQLCLAEAAGADLRPCGKCGRAQCRPCWDFHNGQCSRCGWLMEGLPEALRVYMGQGDG